MDAMNQREERSRHPMTIAEKTALRDSRLAELRKRIGVILAEHSEPLSRIEIRHYLEADRIRQGEGIEVEDTFEIRAAISSLLRDGRAVETTTRQIKGSQ